MGLANVNLTDTFDQWRVKTNQIILYANEQNLQMNLVFDTTNAVYTQSNTDNVRLTGAYTSLNANYQTTNACYNVTNASYTSLNTAFLVANAGFQKANDAYGLTILLGGNTAVFFADWQNSYATLNSSYIVEIGRAHV